MKYQELKEGIGRRLNSAAEDFFTVGYYLRQISEGALFLEDGYESIWDFAKSEFNLSTASASRFMAINSKFSIDGGRTMEPKYIGMGVSKLQEMLTLPDEDLERVTKETTVREIRAMKAAKKKPLSFFGWPETERPEGSLCTTKGCSRDGRGKDGHSCFCLFPPLRDQAGGKAVLYSAFGAPVPLFLHGGGRGAGKAEFRQCVPVPAPSPGEGADACRRRGTGTVLPVMRSL